MFVCVCVCVGLANGQCPMNVARLKLQDSQSKLQKPVTFTLRISVCLLSELNNR